MSEELLLCPFCGGVPVLPDGRGTQYEIWCDCGQALASVQIEDLMTIGERVECPDLCQENDFSYPQEYVDRAKKEAIGRWNERKR